MKLFAFNTKNNGFIATTLKKEYESLKLEEIYQIFNKDNNGFMKDNFYNAFDDVIYTFTNKEDLITFLRIENVNKAYFNEKETIYYWDNKTQELCNLEDIVARKNIEKINEEHFYLIDNEKINNKFSKWFKEVSLFEISSKIQMIFDECKKDLYDIVYKTVSHSILIIGDKLAFLGKNSNNITNIQILNENKLPQDLKDELKSIDFNKQKPEEIFANFSNSFEREKDRILNSKNKDFCIPFKDIKPVSETILKTHELIDHTLKLLNKEKQAILSNQSLDFRKEGIENLDWEIDKFEKMAKSDYLNKQKYTTNQNIVNIIANVNKILENYNLDLEKSKIEFCIPENENRNIVPEVFEDFIEDYLRNELQFKVGKAMLEDETFQNDIKDQIQVREKELEIDDLLNKTELVIKETEEMRNQDSLFDEDEIKPTPKQYSMKEEVENKKMKIKKRR
ncbi:hypothetical protein FQW77_08535 [Campylobacter jejuni]|nr:hypothetical protein [Campylobacter jejuni]